MNLIEKNILTYPKYGSKFFFFSFLKKKQKNNHISKLKFNNFLTEKFFLLTIVELNKCFPDFFELQMDLLSFRNYVMEIQLVFWKLMLSPPVSIPKLVCIFWSMTVLIVSFGTTAFLFNTIWYNTLVVFLLKSCFFSNHWISCNFSASELCIAFTENCLNKHLFELYFLYIPDTEFKNKNTAVILLKAIAKL